MRFEEETEARAAVRAHALVLARHQQSRVPTPRSSFAFLSLCVEMHSKQACVLIRHYGLPCRRFELLRQRRLTVLRTECCYCGRHSGAWTPHNMLSLIHISEPTRPRLI
eukprot:4650729-Amphidinium_carterae.1